MASAEPTQAVAHALEWPQTFRAGYAERLRVWAGGALWLVAGAVLIRSGGFLPGAGLLVIAAITLKGAMTRSAVYVLTPGLLEVHTADGKKSLHDLRESAIERRTGRRGKKTAALTSPAGIVILDERDPEMRRLAATLEALIARRPIQQPPPGTRLLPEPVHVILRPSVWVPVAILAAWYVWRVWD